MNADRFIEKFKEADALLDGHFVLSSGLHSSQYLQCALALEYPQDAAFFARAIARKLAAEQFDTVASPAIGGLIIGYETARALNVKFIWTERQDGEMTLRRGFSVKKDEKILVVEDVITTGGSVKECIDVLKSHGANVAATASIIDRSGGAADVGVPRIALATIEVPVYKPDDCPMCHRGVKAVKPGSREMSK